MQRVRYDDEPGYPNWLTVWRVIGRELEIPNPLHPGLWWFWLREMRGAGGLWRCLRPQWLTPDKPEPPQVTTIETDWWI